MKIDRNSSPIASVGGIDRPVKSAGPSVAASDSVSFDQIEELARSLSEESDVRPDEVKRAQALIADSTWPPQETFHRIARLLTIDRSQNTDKPESNL
jgi:hypothetical protein